MFNTQFQAANNTSYFTTANAVPVINPFDNARFGAKSKATRTTNGYLSTQIPPAAYQPTLGLVDDSADLDAAIASSKSLNKHMTKLSADLYNDYGSRSMGSKYLERADDDLFKMMSQKMGGSSSMPYAGMLASSMPGITGTGPIPIASTNLTANLYASSNPSLPAALAGTSLAGASSMNSLFQPSTNNKLAYDLPAKDYFSHHNHNHHHHHNHQPSQSKQYRFIDLEHGNTSNSNKLGSTSINQILSSLPKSFANYATSAAAGAGTSAANNYTLDPLTNSYTGPLGGTTTTTTTTNNITGTITKYNDNLLDPQQDLNDYYKLAGAKRTKQRTNYNRHYGDENTYLNPLYDAHTKYVPSYHDSKALISGLFDDKTYAELSKANSGSNAKKSWFDEPCNQYVPLSKRSQMWRPKSPPRSFDERYRQSRRMSDQLSSLIGQSNLNPAGKFTVQLTSQLPSHHHQQQQLQQQHQQQQQQQQMPSTLKDLESLNKRTTELISDLNRKFQNM